MKLTKDGANYSTIECRPRQEAASQTTPVEIVMDKDVVGRKNMQAFSQLTTSSIPAIEALKIDSTIAEREEDIIHP